jgi:hypothetical protein
MPPEPVVKLGSRKPRRFLTSMRNFFGSGHRVRALSALARARWISGFPDQALAAAQQALNEVAGDRPIGGISFVYAPGCGDKQKAQELIERLIATSSRASLRFGFVEMLQARLHSITAHDFGPDEIISYDAQDYAFVIDSQNALGRLCIRYLNPPLG